MKSKRKFLIISPFHKPRQKQKLIKFFTANNKYQNTITDSSSVARQLVRQKEEQIKK